MSLTQTERWTLLGRSFPPLQFTETCCWKEVGKTMLTLYAAHLSRQVVLRFNGSCNSTVEDLFGAITNDKENATTFGLAPGPAILAYMFGYWLYIDEANLLKEELVQTLNCLVDDVLSLNQFTKGLGMLKCTSAYTNQPPHFLGDNEHALLVNRHPNFRLIFAQNPRNKRYNREKHSMNILSNFSSLDVTWGDSMQEKKQEWQIIFEETFERVFPNISCTELAKRAVAFHADISSDTAMKELTKMESNGDLFEHHHYMELTVRELKRFVAVACNYVTMQEHPSVEEDSFPQLAIFMSSVYGARFQTSEARAFVKSLAKRHLLNNDVDSPSFNPDPVVVEHNAVYLCGLKMERNEAVINAQTIKDMISSEIRKSIEQIDGDDLMCVVRLHNELVLFLSQGQFMNEYGCYDFVNRDSLNRLVQLVFSPFANEPIESTEKVLEETLVPSLMRVFVAPIRCVEAQEMVLNKLETLLDKENAYNFELDGLRVSKIPNADVNFDPIVLIPEMIENAKECIIAFWLRIPLMLCGPSNAGKLVLLRFLSVIMNVDMTHMFLSADTEVQDMIGLTIPEKDSEENMILRWHDGHLPRVMKKGGMLVFDNILALKSSVLQRLNPVLEERPSLVLTENNEVSPIPNPRKFMRCGSANKGHDASIRKQIPHGTCPIQLTVSLHHSSTSPSATKLHLLMHMMVVGNFSQTLTATICVLYFP
eukprot:m.239385 g.239385  ORF g.239385 m.239385 type:complete len:707 (+) comp13937_c0_seq10:2661-4781(+)